MNTFAKLYARAARRKGGEDALEALIPKPKSARQLAAISDDRWLSEMAKSVFQAGFVWRVVDNKWPAFERHLEQFDLHHVAYLSDEAMDALATNTDLIRHQAKLRATRENAVFMLDIAREYGGFGRFVGDWPMTDFVGLLAVLKARASRMGGTSAQYFLRRMGKDAFLLTPDVIRALIAEGVITRSANSKRDREAVQTAFNQWHAESGRGLTAISRVLAMSVD